jgi:hypothetical protein
MEQKHGQAKSIWVMDRDMADYSIIIQPIDAAPSLLFPASDLRLSLD